METDPILLSPIRVVVLVMVLLAMVIFMARKPATRKRAGSTDKGTSK